MRQNKEGETTSDSTEAIMVSCMTLVALTGSRSQDPRAGPLSVTGTRHRLAWPSPT